MTISELEKLIQYHQQRYYDGNEEISDQQFDLLWNELMEKDPDNPILHSVGKDSSIFPKVKHPIMMGSQQKAATEEEFKKWFDKGYSKKYLVEPKMDGASLLLSYKDGKYILGATRGNGETGDNITENVAKMHGVPKLIPGFTGHVRGEVILPKGTFQVKYEGMANARNAAAGIMKHKDGSQCEDLKVYVYDVFSSTINFQSQKDKMDFLKESGFNTVWYKEAATFEEICKIRDDITNSERATYDYDIDGIVIKSWEVDEEDQMRTRPNKQIAFKFALSQALTIVRDVIWSSKGKYRSPIASFDPVQLNGTTVRNASVANPNLIKKLGLKIGSEVLIEKRGEIIPKIESVVSNSEAVREIEIPTECEHCGSKLINDGTHLYCPNPDCFGTQIHHILKWISVQNIMHLARSTILKLWDEEIVREIKDLYTLKMEDVAGIPGFGSGFQRVLDEINKSRKVSLANFIAGMDFDGIGRRVVQPIIDKYDLKTLEEFNSLSLEQLEDVSGIANLTAIDIKTAFETSYDTMKELNQYVKIEGEKAGSKVSGGKLKGKSFAFTGALPIKRTELEKLVIENGGTIGSSVSKNLFALVTNDIGSGSSKAEKAKKLGIQVLSGDEFLNMIH
jgi:DNA ligase (NAD+)